MQILNAERLEESVDRGFNNSMKFASREFRLKDPLTVLVWLTEEFCAAHRSNLLRKDPIYYSQFGWTEPDDLPYIWPVY